MSKDALAVVALGGNAILKAGEAASEEVQMANLEQVFQSIMPLLSSFPRLVITHGNGPQVGNILLRNQMCHIDIPPMPLDVCVAESQGQIAYLAMQAWEHVCLSHGVHVPLLSMITRTVVSAEDESFLRPNKPIGPYYNERRARELEREKGWSFAPDIKRGGFRRTVPSPDVISLVEEEVLKELCSAMRTPFALLCCGGGGVPVVRSENGYEGVEAVVDKDLASSRLALVLHADILIMVTDVEAVYLDFASDSTRPLRKATVAEMRHYAAEGHFPPGSMGPKVEAAARFVESSGREAVITSAERLMDALEGKAGTTVE
ncbi:MAG: carbamate kinase [Methanomassiliicoccales archaeon]|nr:carbamate kinase [Methanomassiliicoccales archaeon]